MQRCLRIQTVSLLLILIGTAHSHAIESNIQQYADFSSRANLIIESVAEHGSEHGFWGGGKYGAYPAMAQFAVGNVERGREFARQQLEGSGAMFREFGNMALYMKYRHLYDDELKQMVQDNQLHHSALYAPDERGKLPGASENHKLMYASANYLGGLAWPDDYPQKWFEAGRDYLLYWFNEVTEIGFWEQDSPTYFVHHLGPILSVLEFAPEGSEMKRMATMVYEWYLASVAGEYLKGYWITTSARDYVPLHGVHLSEESAAALWLYFGGTNGRIPNPAPSDGHPPYIHWLCAVHLATSDYRPPEILRKIATDRDAPYVHREYMWRNPMRPRDYAFVNQEYGLASTLAEGDRIPPDMTRWKLQWVPQKSEMEPSAFLMNHPKADDDGWKNWEGASPYEQVLQHKGALIAVYNIPEDDKYPFIDGPLDYSVYQQILQKNNWWFFHTGRIMFGVYAAKKLRETDETRLAYKHYGNTAETSVLRSDGNKNALAVQTALLAEYGGGSAQEVLERFANSVLQKCKIIAKVDSSPLSIEFHTLDGDTLELQYDGFRKINGKDLNFENWPMLDNPWMRQDLRSKQLTLEWREQKRIYDFQEWKIK